MTKPRGYFGVAAWRTKTAANVGTLLRSANIFGASFVAFIGERYHPQGSDTMQTHRHLPVWHFAEMEDFWTHVPMGCQPVAVELCDGARDLCGWHHPESAVYILGPEDGSLCPEILKRCVSRVRIPGEHCLNLATAGSIVMYDRIAKATRAA